MIVIVTGFIPLSPLSVVSTMLMWESSQWLGKNIVRSIGYQHFLIFPQCFLLFPKQISSFQSHLFCLLQMFSIMVEFYVKYQQTGKQIKWLPIFLYLYCRPYNGSSGGGFRDSSQRGMGCPSAVGFVRKRTVWLVLLGGRLSGSVISPHRKYIRMYGTPPPNGLVTQQREINQTLCQCDVQMYFRHS